MLAPSNCFPAYILFYILPFVDDESILRSVCLVNHEWKTQTEKHLLRKDIALHKKLFNTCSIEGIELTEEEKGQIVEVLINLQRCRNSFAKSTLNDTNSIHEIMAFHRLPTPYFNALSW